MVNAAELEPDKLQVSFKSSRGFVPDPLDSILSVTELLDVC